MTTDKADSFWKSLTPLLDQVLKDPENDTLINQIDDLVSKLGEYDWEYGPGKKAEFYFCISPNLNADLIPQIDEIISHAPVLDGWEFISCKSRKEDVFSWMMLNENGEEITIDTHGWKCVVYKFSDGTVDLDVKISGVKGDSDIQQLAVNIHLTNLLGERNFIKVVKGFNIVSEFAEKDKGRSIPVNDLFKLIAQHIEGVHTR